ncbi:MAG: hypothetical protein ACR2P3_06900 [Geminicoccaceae bacterium]
MPWRYRRSGFNPDFSTRDFAFTLDPGHFKVTMVTEGDLMGVDKTYAVKSNRDGKIIIKAELNHPIVTIDELILNVQTLALSGVGALKSSFQPKCISAIE